MGDVGQPSAVLLITAAFSRHETALDWGREQAAAAWGPIALASPGFVFGETDYYEATMGPGLKKYFWAFERLVDPAALAELKLAANRWEEEYSRLALQPELRPLNL